MKVAAIITEYNPFHLGHAYQLSQIKADFVIVIMSGNYVQRGEPALLDKWTRTEMALANGIDLVLELPAIFSTGSAEYFARGAVFLLEQSHIVNELYFGAEHPNIKDLQLLAKFLNTESPEFSKHLQKHLKDGNSFASARAAAIHDCFPDSDFSSILKGSNNILAIEYLRALDSYQSRIAPILIARKGQNYLAEHYEPDTFLSATSIRRMVQEKKESLLAKALPQESHPYLIPSRKKNLGPIFPEDIFPFIKYSLLAMSKEELLELREMKPELLNRFLENIVSAKSYADFTDLCVSRNFPLSKVKRALLAVFLKQKGPQEPTLSNSYLRILGFRQSALPLLSHLKAKSALPLISNNRQVRYLSESAYRLYQENLNYDRLYDFIQQEKYQYKTLSPEQRTPVIHRS